MDKKWIVALMCCVLFVSGKNVWAEEITFNFKDPKGVNSISIFLDSVLEPIMGVASGISGHVIFDPEKQKAIKGKIVVAADKIQMANQMMTKVLHSEDWLHAAKFPTIEFSLKKIMSTASKKDTQSEYVISGDFTCKGITKEIQMPVFVSHLPGKLKARNRKGNGDLMVLRSRFSIDRMAFEINPAMSPETVAKEIQLNVSIVGYAEKN